MFLYAVKQSLYNTKGRGGTLGFRTRIEETSQAGPWLSDEKDILPPVCLPTDSVSTVSFGGFQGRSMLQREERRALFALIALGVSDWASWDWKIKHDLC